MLPLKKDKNYTNDKPTYANYETWSNVVSLSLLNPISDWSIVKIKSIIILIKSRLIIYLLLYLSNTRTQLSIREEIVRQRRGFCLSCHNWNFPPSLSLSFTYFSTVKSLSHARLSIHFLLYLLATNGAIQFEKRMKLNKILLDNLLQKMIYDMMAA